jgi:hypothetical protein
MAKFIAYWCVACTSSIGTLFLMAAVQEESFLTKLVLFGVANLIYVGVSMMLVRFALWEASDVE